jgi:hypothetical protein
MPGFDPNCFDTGAFDAAFTVPYMQKAVIGRGFRRLKAGSARPILLYIQQMDSTPGRLFSMNPQVVQVQIFLPQGIESGVTIQYGFDPRVFDPGVFSTGSAFYPGLRVIYTDMVNKGIGIYEYIHQSLPTDFLGKYTGNFKMVNGDKTTITESQLFFELI